MSDMPAAQLLWVIAFLLLLIFLKLVGIHHTLEHPSKTAQKESDREMEKYAKEAEREKKTKQ